MKKGGGKAKGAEFERHVCKTLSLAITKGDSDALFWRSAMSGGRATIQAKDDIKNKAQAGDISPIAKEGIVFADKFMIECKFYKDFNLHQIFLGNRKNKVLQFWNRLVYDADSVEKWPILIAKQNFLDTFVFVYDVAPMLVFCERATVIVPSLNMACLLYTDFLDILETKDMSNVMTYREFSALSGVFNAITNN